MAKKHPLSPEAARVAGGAVGLLPGVDTHVPLQLSPPSCCVQLQLPPPSCSCVLVQLLPPASCSAVPHTLLVHHLLVPAAGPEQGHITMVPKVILHPLLYVKL